MMKILIAALLMVFAGGCTHGETYSASHRYHAASASSVGLLYVDHIDRILLASVGNRFQSTSIQRIASDGSVDWAYVPQGDEPAETANIHVASLFQNAKKNYVACTNRYPSDRTKLSSAMHILSEKGALVSRSEIAPPANEYKGNVLVEKCWEDEGHTFILGTIYGGANFDLVRYPNTIYWLRTIDKLHNTSKDILFSSNMHARAKLTDAVTFEGKLFFTAENGVFGELVSVDPISGDIIQRRTDGEARLVLGSERISTVSLRNGRIGVNGFDRALKPVAMASMNIDRDSYFIGAYAPNPDRIAIVVTSLGVGTSTLRVIEAGNGQPTFNKVFSQRLAPPAVLSTTYAKDSKGRGLFHFVQFHEHERQTDNALLTLEKR